MSDFPDRRLGELVECLDYRRRPVRASERVAGRYPYYGASGVVDFVADYLFDGDFLLVAEDGENLRTRKTPAAFMATGRFWVNNHAHVLVGNDSSDTRYLSYAVEASDLSGFITGSTQPKLTKDALLRIEVPAPSKSEQRAIAGVLGALDDKIESNRRLVRHCSGLLAALSESLVSTSRTALADVASASRSMVDPQSLGSAKVDHFSIPAFDASGLPDRCVASSIQSGKFEVEGESILVSRLNPGTPRIWHVAPTNARALCSTEFLVLQPVEGVGLGALWLAVISPDFTDELARRATGTSFSHQRVRPHDAMSVELPDVGRLDRVVAEDADGLLRVALMARRQSATLATLRDALLPELLSGRLRVREAERVVEGVV